MKAVILAGGLGSRITEESHLRPKPMVEIGEQPLLWHIMKLYSHYGVNDFIICAGYMQQKIKEYFSSYYLHRSDITFDFTRGGAVTVHSNVAEPWKVTVADTGMHTMTGGRLLRARGYIGEEPFLLTYGDGVADVDIGALLNFHHEKKKLATVTAVSTQQRFGVMRADENSLITEFREKSGMDNISINGGFMVLEPKIFDYIEGDATVFEREPMERLTAEGQLAAYQHKGFWQCMDTLRDKLLLEQLWDSGKAPWKVW
ncbi:MAG: glucose-1-phosphate cytidylyltransferase [Oscillospiraceae bacterium]|jgi:glucose-1-phosphate cytidylyltransferase|nr:glucose-1-phosphate cytidylyltransferase [Oscillospiraceae bacterium]